VADDVLASIGLELARIYATDAHPKNEEELERLVSRLARFRSTDALRARFRRRLIEPSLGSPDDIADPLESEDQTVRALDARGFLLELIDGLDRLDPEDRALLTRPLDEEDVAPMSGTERVRILRLRRQLVNDISVRLRGGKKR